MVAAWSLLVVNNDTFFAEVAAVRRSQSPRGKSGRSSRKKEFVPPKKRGPLAWINAKLGIGTSNFDGDNTLRGLVHSVSDVTNA